MTGQAEKDRQNKTAMTVLPGQGSSTALLGENSQGRAKRGGQPEKDSQNRTTRTGQAELDSQNGDRQDRTGRTILPRQDCRDRTAQIS
jgi:hypothetical protein